MDNFVPRKFKAKISQSGLDDLGASGVKFRVTALEKDRIYEEQDPRFLSTKQRGVVIDDNGCWWHYGTPGFRQRFEEIK